MTSQKLLTRIPSLSKTRAGLAQLVEQLICNQQVGSSSPPASTKLIQRGEIPEWPKGTDCKSVGSAFGGSNPPLPTICRFNFGPGSSVVERFLGKEEVGSSILLPGSILVFKDARYCSIGMH